MNAAAITVDPTLVQCVVAWTVEEVEWTGERWAPDLGERPPVRVVKVPRTAMWLNEARPEDVEKARAVGSVWGWEVFTFTGEEDPLAAAKAAMRAAGACS